MVILASWSARGNDDGWSSRSQWHSEPKKYFHKSPPQEWDGNHPEKTWRDCRRTLKQRLSTTVFPSERHGMLLWRALTGDAKLLISHFRDEDLLCWDAGQRIFDALAQAHKQVSEFQDLDDFDNAFYKLHRERNQTLPQFANVARAAYRKHDAYGYLLPDRTKGMVFLRQAKIPEHLEDHNMAKTNISRNFSDLVNAIQILARRPMSQVSSSFLSYDDEWDDSTNASTATLTTTTLSTTMGTTMSTTNPRTKMVSGSTFRASLTTPRSKSRSWPVCWRSSRRAERGRARVSGQARWAGAKVSPVMF